NVFPSQIEDVLKSIPEVGDQFMVYVDRVNHLDEMKIEVEIKKEFFSGELRDLERIQRKIQEQLKAILQVRTEIALVEPESLPRFEGKAKRVVDKRGDKF
ncbi:MAG: phenylacetate--CoA ligase, partial [Methanomicrobium sp.]|nr:phenylacetate--CoA ligase [Methanomicrobium sp.]